MEESSEKQWYYTSGGVRYGPVPFGRLKELAAVDHIDRFNDMVWVDGMEDWVPASEVKGLFAGTPAPSSILARTENVPFIQAPVKRASYSLYVSLVVAGIMVGLLTIFLSWAAHAKGSTPSDEVLLFVGLLSLVLILLSIAIVVVAIVYLYRAWAMIQDNCVRTTPGKAVGFMFIPLFNLYWVFVAYCGWAKGYNRYIENHRLDDAPRMPEPLFLTFAILLPVYVFVQYIPVLDVLMVFSILTVNLFVYRYICRAVNFMEEQMPGKKTELQTTTFLTSSEDSKDTTKDTALAEASEITRAEFSKRDLSPPSLEKDNDGARIAETLTDGRLNAALDTEAVMPPNPNAGKTPKGSTLLGSMKTMSNMEKYTHVSYVENTDKKTEMSDVHPPMRNTVLAPGAFPVCAVCRKDCRTTADKEYHVLYRHTETMDAPMLCRACKAVVCQQCAGIRGNENESLPCPVCGSSEGLDWLMPFVYCDSCGKRSLLLSSDGEGEARYLLLDKGAIPIYCADCDAINCSFCQRNGKCHRCGSSNLEVFVPGYTGTGTIIVDHDSSGHITAAAPGAPAAAQAAVGLEAASPERDVVLKESIKSLRRRILTPKKRIKALEELLSLGLAAKPALEDIREWMYCGQSDIELMAIRAFAAAGPVAEKELPHLIAQLKEENDEHDKIRAALLIGFFGSAAKNVAQDAIPLLRKMLDIKPTFFSVNDTGVRCAAAIALLNIGELDSDTATKIIAEHMEALVNETAYFPTLDFLQKTAVWQ